MELVEGDFLYINRITSITSDKVSGMFRFNRNASWEYLECAAQLCSLHVRWLVECKRHSFLLKINKFGLVRPIEGSVHIDAEQIGCSSESYKYSIFGKLNEEVVFSGILVIGTVDYTSDLDREDISNHYKGVLECLMKDMIWK